MNKPKYMVNSIIYNDNIYIMGGFNDQSGTNILTIEKYNLKQIVKSKVHIYT